MPAFYGVCGQGAILTRLIDHLQYANRSEKIFQQMRRGGVDAVHVTIAYHESFREMVLQLEAWNRWFQRCPDLIMRGTSAADVEVARSGLVGLCQMAAEAASRYRAPSLGVGGLAQP